MALSPTQFGALFLGAFGQSLADAGLTLDTSDPAAPVARKGDHRVSLFVINDKAIEWQLDGKELMPFTLNGRDERSTARKADALAKLKAAL
jgi:hypothetical protein